MRFIRCLLFFRVLIFQKWHPCLHSHSNCSIVYGYLWHDNRSGCMALCSWDRSSSNCSCCHIYELVGSLTYSHSNAHYHLKRRIRLSFVLFLCCYLPGLFSYQLVACSLDEGVEKKLNYWKITVSDTLLIFYFFPNPILLFQSF